MPIEQGTVILMPVADTTEVPLSPLPPLIPRSVLFGNPERAMPRLSPDGTRLAYIAPRDGVMNLYLRTVGAQDDRPLTQETVRPIRSFDWTENGKYILYPQDTGGDENWHLFRVDVETGETTDLTPFPERVSYLLTVEPKYPDTVLIVSNQRDPHCFDVYSCDLATGQLTLLAENRGDIQSWTADSNLQVRAAITARPDGSSELVVRDTPQSEWRTLLTIPFGEEIAPLCFTPGGDGLYLLTDAEVNTQRLYLADVRTGERRLIHSREDVDVTGVLFHPMTRFPDVVGYNRDRQEWHALEPDTGADFEALRGVDDGDIKDISRSRDNRFWTVGFLRDNGPMRWYLYRRDTRQATFLFSARPEMDGLTMARMQPVEITARDGLRLPSYLTLPPNLPPKNLPLVLNVHGGPWARNSWGFQPEVQWLANRGYAVLQVNYRGSAGFGKAHLNAGNREWAGKMHDDLVDAVQWAIAEGIADPARIAIMGGSYGGYATLVGLTFTPELFACGVDVVGPSNLITLFNSFPPYWELMRTQFTLRMGDPEKEAEFLKSRSPLFFADRIVRPLLVAQGANDPRVTKIEADQIVAAARDSGKDVMYLLFEDEGHGFARPENRMKYTAAAEAFLAKHLGGRSEPAHPGEEPPLIDPRTVTVA
jgi:dipeptidyl aminopeptidase/acylaminoacyl peptidase